MKSSETTRSRGRLVWLFVLLLGAVAYLVRAPGPTSGTKNIAPPTATTSQVASAPRAPTRMPGAAEPRPPARLAARAVRKENPDLANGGFLGIVRNAGSSEPVAFAEVVFSHRGVAETVTSDAAGLFRFEPSQRGTYKLAVASAEGYFPYAPEWDASPIELVARANLEVEGIVVYLTPKVRYLGQVVDETGMPIEGAVIRIGGSAEAALASQSDTLRSGPGGRFHFHARDFSSISAEFAGVSGNAVLDGPSQISGELVVVLGRYAELPGHAGEEAAQTGNASLHGVVVDGDGQPVPAFNVMLTSATGMGAAAVAERAVFDGDGAFHIRDLPPGSYRAHIAASGLANGSAVGIASENNSDPIRVQLREGASVRGVVVSADTGAPLELAKVSLESALGGGPSARPMIVSEVTDAEGRFVLRGLPPGRRSLFAAASNHNSRIVSALELVEGEELGPVRIALGPVAEGERPVLELAGIGARLRPTEAGMHIDGVLEGGGAAEAGLATGDTIVAIDGESVPQLGWDDAIQRIRGPVGTEVRLAIHRGEDVISFSVIRRAIRA